MNTLVWVSVGGNECEPARLVENNGVKTVFTIGCADGTIIADGCGIEIVEARTAFYRPDTPAVAEKRRVEWEKQVARDKKRGIHHGYRRFE